MPVLERTHCSECGSNDNLVTHENGSQWCYTPGCSRNTKGTQKKYTSNFVQGTVSELPARGISKDICEFYEYKIGSINDQTVHIENFKKNGELVGQKYRSRDKKFWGTGTTDFLWGMDKFEPRDDRSVTITEGAIDAMSVLQAIRSKYPNSGSAVVSLPNGAQSVKKALANSMEWLLGFKEIILAFDNDEAGHKALQDALELLEGEPVKVARWPRKDANDSLKLGETEEIIRAIFNATSVVSNYSVDLDTIELAPTPRGIEWPWKSLDKLTYGIHFPGLYTIAAGASVGKTTILMQLANHLVDKTDLNLGLVFLETPADVLLKRLVGQSLGKRIHLPGDEWNHEEISNEMNKFKGRIHVLKQFGTTSPDIIFRRIRSMVKANNCKIIMLDHLTALCASMEDDRKGLDIAMAKLSELAHDLNICIFLVSHLAKPPKAATREGGKGFEDGRRVSASDLRGSQSIQYWSTFILGMERNLTSEDPIARRTLTIRVLKDRFSGQSSGLYVDLMYDLDKDMYREITNDWDGPPEGTKDTVQPLSLKEEDMSPFEPKNDNSEDSYHQDSEDPEDRIPKTSMIAFDIESNDPFIGLGLGAGWVYPDSSVKFEVLGVAIANEHGEFYTTNLQEAFDYIDHADTLVAHNALYDIGSIIRAGYPLEKLKEKTILDTQVGAFLTDNHQPRSLDALAKRYLNKSKDNQVLIDFAVSSGLFPLNKKQTAVKEKGGQVQVDKAKVLKWCKSNMKAIQEKDIAIMAQYAANDARVTFDLLPHLWSDYENLRHFSSFVFPLYEMRKKGIRVDLKKAKELKKSLIPRISEMTQKCYDMAGEEFSLTAVRSMAEVLKKRGLKLPQTTKGSESVTSTWLDKQEDELCQLISKTKKLIKFERDFVNTIIKFQAYTCPEASDYGVLYPELSLFNARTGRSSSSCPNFQQWPADEDLGVKIRDVFIPHEGEKFYSCDFSQQELRVAVHFASASRCRGVEKLVGLYHENPKVDVYQWMADEANITRKQAKAVTLGALYGMGAAKLKKQLGVDDKEAERILESFHAKLPWVKELTKKTSKILKDRGYIKTISGRKLLLEKDDEKDLSYKATNMLVQGSSADQTYAAIKNLYDKGIVISFPIHDQILISGTEEAGKATYDAMVEAYRLHVPVVVDWKEEGGSSWAEAGH